MEKIIEITIVFGIMILGYVIISTIILIYKSFKTKEYCPKCEDYKEIIQLDYEKGIYHCTHCKTNFFIN